ncbi:hypothetical protein ES695_05565 [Candidatus Atribacteria bacterium 1244-E10-H5-B2]|nr:MAG: hypothetical protein ES695_05565 [Candidatus Atribacteria bacterium 1244-E10-H5-B2]
MENKDREFIELIELTEKVKEIISTPLSDLKDLSFRELEFKRTDVENLTGKLRRYSNILRHIGRFRDVWDSINRKDDYEKIFKIYFHETCGDRDDIPF